jgi:hypothetical protein
MRPIRELMQDRRVAGALAAVALVFVAYRAVKSVRPAQPPAGQSTEAPTPQATTEPPPVAFAPLAVPPAEFPPGWSGPSWTWDRNPFLAPSRERIPARAGGGRNGGEGRPPAGTGMDGGVPELRGTVISREASMAIFGSRLVPAGGTVGEWTLVKVDPYRVSLRRGNETRVLELYKQ